MKRIDAPRTGGWPAVLRVIAMALAAVSIAWGVTLPIGVLAAAIGAGIGVVVGGRLGRSSLRLWAVMVGLAAGLAAAYLLARATVDFSFMPLWLGTGRALKIASALRLGSIALVATAALRAAAVRRPVVVGLEVTAVAAAIPLSFAAHRDGVIARPLWLGDWSWGRGLDPALALLGIGGAAVVVLAILLLAEGRSRRAPSAFLALALLTLLAILVMRKVGLPQPDALTGLGADAGADDGGERADASPDAGDAGRGKRHRGSHEVGDAGAEQEDGGADDDQDDAGDDGGRSEVPPDIDKASGGGGGEAPMAVMILDDDYSPPSQGYYLRQDAWSELNGTRLVRTTRGDVDVDVPETFPSKDSPVPQAPDASGRATVRTFIALLVDHPRPFGLESPLSLAPAQNPNPARFKRAYRVVSRAQSASYKDLFGHKAGNPAWPPDVLAYYTKAPDDPRYAALAKSIIDRAPERIRKDPFGEAVAVKLRLDDAFKYSTKHRHAGAADPTGDFLFGDQIGYCVHFAHAAVYLWRTLGIPSRVGTGYRVEEDERHGGSSVLVRGRDAHAWPELYLEGYGWIVLDIAPKTNLDPPAPPVDTELQRMLGEMARSMPKNPEDVAPETPAPPSWLWYLIGYIFGLVAGGGIFWLSMVKLWRTLAPHWCAAGALPWIGYRRALDMLSEVGESRRFGESREAFARRMRSVAPSFEALTTLHLGAALGAPGKEAGPRSEWSDGLAALRREIGRAKPLGRRIIGVLNPGSFLRSK